MSANGHRCPVCDMFRDLTPDYQERRRFAILQASAVIAAGVAASVGEAPQIGYCINTAMALLCEIENREQEAQS